MIEIQGIEITQAIQYYKSSQHLTNPAEQLPDNSVTLVTGKPAWVRVYVASTESQPVTGVTGQLKVMSTSIFYVQEPPFTLPPQPPGSVTAQVSPNYVAQRSSITATLNFIIPADKLIGALRIEAQISAPGSPALSASIDVTITLQQTLQLRGIMIGYNGPDPSNPGQNLVIAPPTLADLQSTAAWTLLVYPVQSASVFEVASTITSTSPLTGTASNGSCTPAWYALNNAVAAAKLADGNLPGYIYYGLMPANFPNTSNVGGCETSGVSSGPVGAQIAMAHEIGHACGRSHGPCGSVGSSADPNYPAYPPYDSAANRIASIGEYGLDIITGNIPTPDTARDFMSYCGPPWISLYGNALFTNNSALNPETVGVEDPWWRNIVAYDPWWWLHYQPDPPWWIDPGEVEVWPVMTQEVISLIGVIENENVVTVNQVARTQVFSSEINGARTNLIAELQDASGRVLASGPVFSIAGAGGCGCGGASAVRPGPAVMQAFIPNVARGARLVIRSEEKRLWQRRAPARAVSIGSVNVVESENGKIEVSWKATGPRGAGRSAWVRYSSDNGRTWKSIVTDVTGYRVVIEGAHLPVGKILFEVVAHDGFHSTRSTPVEFTNAARVPEPVILYPNPKARLVAGMTLGLLASVALQKGYERDRLQYRWTIDGNDAGEGLQLFDVVPAPGRHRVTFTVSDQQMGESREAQIEFTSVQARIPTRG